MPLRHLVLLGALGFAAWCAAVSAAEAPWTWAELGRGLPRDGQWRNGFDVADVDGDGRLDLVHGPPRKRPGPPRLFRGVGDGGFEASGPASISDLILDYGDVAASDFNGDGTVDLAFAVHQRGLAVILNQGAGRFAAEAGYHSGQIPAFSFSSRALAAGDLDGDGRTDLAVIGEGPQVGGGRGSYGARVLLNRLPEPWSWLELAPDAGRLFGGDVVIGDFDGNGHNDLVTDSRVQGQLGVVFWNSADDGFASGELDAARAGGYLEALAAADFGGRGSPDLVAAYLVPQGSGASTGLDLYRASKDRSWRRQELPWPEDLGRPTALATGDPDGDGDPDLVALTDTGAIVAFVNSEGGLRPAAGLDAAEGGRGCRGFHVQLADLDGDGADELLASFADERCRDGGSLRAWALVRRPPS